MEKETLTEIISILGEDRIKRVYEITKGEKISFALLNKCVQHDQIEEAIHSGCSFKQIAKNHQLSRMSIYRIFRKRVLKSQK